MASKIVSVWFQFSVTNSSDLLLAFLSDGMLF